MSKQISYSIYRHFAITTASSAIFALVAITSSVQADSNIGQEGIEAPFVLAATDGMDRRQDRREDHRENRGDRNDTRQDCRQEEGVGKDKRDCKQDGRQDRRGDDDNDED
ncbi:MAG TPA: hypothetical protein ENK70_00895 [Methylophaga sp.]|nr:MAG: hypothetical protein DRQ46_10775 [Gammaproteobacteria bacterium]RKZ99507.1 MAG: hypothetical protein DRQ42_07595 [Gammaproteobacteria bacterium]HHA18249.1 hypothetical protein [Methylophaga sp.]